MDEPFGALDEIVRDMLNEQLLRLWEETGKTVLFVTHSIPEAVFLSTKIVVMSPRPGRIFDIIDCDFPRDRQLEIRETPEFMASPTACGTACAPGIPMMPRATQQRRRSACASEDWRVSGRPTKAGRRGKPSARSSFLTLVSTILSMATFGSPSFARESCTPVVNKAALQAIARTSPLGQTFTIGQPFAIGPDVLRAEVEVFGTRDLLYWVDVTVDGACHVLSTSTQLEIESVARLPMKSALPIVAVLLAIVAAWYVAAALMNAPLQRDVYANAGRADYSTQDLIVDLLNMERPKLPGPHQIVAELWRRVFATAPTSKRSLVYHGLITLEETLIGFLIGAALGIGLAVVIVSMRWLERSMMPWIVASQTVPIIALAPMIVVILNQFDITGVAPKAAIAAYLSFFPITVGMVKGFRSPDPLQLDLMRTYSATRTQTFLKLRAPASAPFFFASMKIGAAAALVAPWSRR